MTTGRLRVLAIIAPVGFWLALLLFRTLAFGEERSPVGDVFAPDLYRSWRSRFLNLGF